MVGCINARLTLGHVGRAAPINVGSGRKLVFMIFQILVEASSAGCFRGFPGTDRIMAKVSVAQGGAGPIAVHKSKMPVSCITLRALDSAHRHKVGRSFAETSCHDLADRHRGALSRHRGPLRYLCRLTGTDRSGRDTGSVRRRMRRAGSCGLVVRVAANLAREWERTRRGMRLLEGAGTAPDRRADPSGRGLAAEERRRRVRAALQRLTERDRTILLMREEGFTHREIAEAVGTTTGSVGTLIARAINKLAAELGLGEEDL